METAERAQGVGELYEHDFHAWLQQQLALLRAGNIKQIDFVHLAEEIEDMGKSQRQVVASNLVVVLLHLLKYRFQPDQRSNGWRASLREHRRRLRRAFDDSPSLRRYAEEVFMECYQDAREQASDETGLPLATFPVACPFTPQEVLDRNFLPAAE